MTTGKWIPRHGRNTKIIRRLRATWNQLLKQRPNEVRLAHVRSHTIIAGNDMADWLADRGAVGERVNMGQALAWALRWVSESARRQILARGIVLGDPQGIG